MKMKKKTNIIDNYDSWELRFFKCVENFHNGAESFTNSWFEIREVYYDKNDSIIGWSKKTLPFKFDNYKDWFIIRETVNNAASLPVLQIINGKATALDYSLSSIDEN